MGGNKWPIYDIDISINIISLCVLEAGCVKHRQRVWWTGLVSKDRESQYT